MSAIDQQKASLEAWRDSQPKRERGEKEKLVNRPSINHTCPHCWRGDTGLVYAKSIEKPVTCRVCLYERKKRYA